MAGLPTFKFDLSIFEEVGDDRISMNGMTVSAYNIQVMGYPVHNPDTSFDYPIYFEVEGLRFHYIFSVWENKVEIEVCDKSNYRTLSTMLPRNQSELLEAINTVAEDFEDRIEQAA